MDVAQAREQLGDAVPVYLDAGRAPGGVASTIVDATGDGLRVVRAGALSRERLSEVALLAPEPSAETAQDPTRPGEPPA